jgi:hypothetical protein
MADAGLMIGWDRVVSGKDEVAVELWGEMMVYLRSLHASGHITHFEPVLLGAHGGHLNGFVLLRGAQDALDGIRNSEEFLEFNVRANKVLEGFLVVRAHYGEEVAKIFRLYATT